MLCPITHHFPVREIQLQLTDRQTDRQIWQMDPKTPSYTDISFEFIEPAYRAVQPLLIGRLMNLLKDVPLMFGVVQVDNMLTLRIINGCKHGFCLPRRYLSPS